MIRLRNLALAAAGALGATTAVAMAGTTTYVLSDHPDSNQSPPPYGLRFDGLFGGMSGAAGGVTTFSFSHPMADMKLVIDDADAGASPNQISIRIFGTAYGGEDSGSGYGFGEGLYEIDFMYQFNVSALADGWEVDPSNAGNGGTIEALTGDAAGMTFNLYEEVGASNFFQFRQDGHRLTNAERASLNDPFVGRAWVTDDMTGRGINGTQDWLFIGQIIPTPSAVGLASFGLLAGAGVRRRRNI